MNSPGREPSQWINVTGSGNNIATGAGARAGNITHGNVSAQDMGSLLEQIRAVAAAAPDRAAGEQAHAAVAAIEADMAKPAAHRFSVAGALAALGKIGDTIPGLVQLVDALTRAIR